MVHWRGPSVFRGSVCLAPGVLTGDNCHDEYLFEPAEPQTHPGREPRHEMTSSKRVVLKGELHSSAADLREEKSLLEEDVDVLVLEGSQSSPGYRIVAAWFHVSIALLAWILASLYQSKDVLVDLAAVRGIDVVYTRPDDAAPLETAPLSMKAVSAGLFYVLVPSSLWIGFVTPGHLVGSLSLFLGLVLPLLVVRLYNTNRADEPANRDRRIAETIAEAGGPGETVLAVVGAGHLHGVERRLESRVDLDVRPPVYDVWSLRHARAVGLPALKAGFVLFSLYVASEWVVVRAVDLLTPMLASVLA